MSSKSREESGCNFDDCTNQVFHTLGESGLLGGMLGGAKQNKTKHKNVALPWEALS